VNTVVPGLLSLKACAAGSHISIAQRVSQIPEGDKQPVKQLTETNMQLSSLLVTICECENILRVMEDAFTSLVEAFRKSTTAREHIERAIFGHFRRLWFYRSVLRLLCSLSLTFT